MTAQMPDRILIDGAEHDLLATPLSAFLAHVDGAPRLVAPHTANNRGHLAQWHLAGDELVLDDVRGWLADGSEVGPDVVLPGVDLPLPATWVHGTLRVGMGRIVRYVHAGFESRYDRELVLNVSGGRVSDRRELAAVGSMGMAGPYRLDEPLLGELAGGGFGQLIAASDLDGQPLVAKAPRPSGAGGGGTEMWMDTPAGRHPVHVPAKAFVQLSGEWLVSPVDGTTTAAILRAEAEVLDRDRGVLLPASLGIWEHETSGVPVLVMERLEGERPGSVHDVRGVLAAVADAVDRGTFDAHGDLKLEHVFIDVDGRVRICDPAPRFAEPFLRAFTPAYNPEGWLGSAADAVACASMLRYLRDGPGVAGVWADELLDAETPPGWATDHREALARLDALMEPAALAATATDLPPDPGSSSRRIVITGVTDTPDPFPPYAPTSEELAVRAAIDRVVIGAADVVLGQWAEGNDAPPTAAVLAVEAGAVQATLGSVLEPTVVSTIVYGAEAGLGAVSRLFEWVSEAFATLSGWQPYDVGGIELRVPDRAREDAVSAVLGHTLDAYLAMLRAVVSSEGSDDEEWGAHTWQLLDRGVATPPDLAWAAGSLVAELALVRRAQPVDQRGSLAMVLDELGAKLRGGIIGWDHRAGGSVSRPLRYRMRTRFDGGSGAMVWSASDPAVADRWDHWVDHFELPIPLALAARVQRLVVRYDLTIPGRVEHVPFGPGEHEEFARSYHEVCDDLERALGPAYVIETRMAP